MPLPCLQRRAAAGHETANRLPANDGFTPDEPDSVRGKASLVVWISLLSATAGLAGISAVRSPLHDLLGHEASVAGIDQQHSGKWRSDPPRPESGHTVWVASLGSALD